MTSPREQVVELTELAESLSEQADFLDEAGMHNAALALRDQADAADAHARKVAAGSGDPELMRIWQ